jgi:hypothetical protein
MSTPQSQNSSYTLQELVDIARAMGDLAPTLPTGGSYETVALSAINDAMTAMLAGSSKGSQFNFKFNRTLVAPFFVNSYQQDYAQNNLNIGWLESCGAYNTSSTQIPKPFRVVEVKRDVLLTNAQTGNLAKIQWIQNDSQQYGQWGERVRESLTGLFNPGPGITYTNPIGMMSMPRNPVLQVKDLFGNLWALTTYGTCGMTNPFTTNQNPLNQFPTLLNPTQVAITVMDGTVVWTAINPKGQGFRINPMPTQTGPVWELQPVAQSRIPKFTTLGQFLEPVPDDYFTYLKTGFFCQCYRFHPDPKIRMKFETEFKMWMQALDNAVRQGSREEDDWGFVPNSNVMDTGWAFNPVNPAMPYGPWGGG